MAGEDVYLRPPVEDRPVNDFLSLFMNQGENGAFSHSPAHGGVPVALTIELALLATSFTAFVIFVQSDLLFSFATVFTPLQSLLSRYRPSGKQSNEVETKKDGKNENTPQEGGGSNTTTMMMMMGDEEDHLQRRGWLCHAHYFTWSWVLFELTHRLACYLFLSPDMLGRRLMLLPLDSSDVSFSQSLAPISTARFYLCQLFGLLAPFLWTHASIEEQPSKGKTPDIFGGGVVPTTEYDVLEVDRCGAFGELHPTIPSAMDEDGNVRPIQRFEDVIPAFKSDEDRDWNIRAYHFLTICVAVLLIEAWLLFGVALANAKRKRASRNCKEDDGDDDSSSSGVGSGVQSSSADTQSDKRGDAEQGTQCSSAPSKAQESTNDYDEDEDEDGSDDLSDYLEEDREQMRLILEEERKERKRVREETRAATSQPAHSDSIDLNKSENSERKADDESHRRTARHPPQADKNRSRESLPVATMNVVVSSWSVPVGFLYAACFAYSGGLPLLLGTVFPVSVVILVILSMLQMN